MPLLTANALGLSVLVPLSYLRDLIMLESDSENSSQSNGAVAECRDAAILTRMDKEDRIRFEHPGIGPMAIAFFVGVVAIIAIFGRYPVSLAILAGIYTALMVLHNGIFIVMARMLGLREIQEIGVWIGPAMAWFRVRGILCRFNLLPMGAYVRFLDSGSMGRPTGFRLLSPLRQAVLTLSAPVLFVFAGWNICAACGIGDGFVRALGELATLKPGSWVLCRKSLLEFIADVSSFSSAFRATGILVLAAGIINLLPLPLVSGGMAILFLLKPAMGEKRCEKVRVAWTVLSLPIMLVVVPASIIMVFEIVFAKL